MEMGMDLTKKTTILFSPELHRRLTELAARRDVSLGELVREACEAQYGLGGTTIRREAAAALAGFTLPVDEPAAMKVESVTSPDDLLP
jgi:predicted transcriptional regulator